ncbi:TPA: EAL domain-containing protein [Raoultella ornithinolytica]
MEKYFIAEPIMSLDGNLLGVEMLTRFTVNNSITLNPEKVISTWDFSEKRMFLYEQSNLITQHSFFFINNGLFCSINIDHQMALLLRHDRLLQSSFSNFPFLTLEISENFQNLNLGLGNPLLNGLKKDGFTLWLDDLGSGNANVAALMDSCFEVIKIDREFFLSEVVKPTFGVLINHIKKYCKNIIIEGIEEKHWLPLLGELGIWGAQGYLYKSVHFDQLEQLEQLIAK